MTWKDEYSRVCAPELEVCLEYNNGTYTDYFSGIGNTVQCVPCMPSFYQSSMGVSDCKRYFKSNFEQDMK